MNRRRGKDELVTPVTQKDRALQTCAREFLLLSLGLTITPDEATLFFSLAALALPMRYRFPRGYVERLKQLAINREFEAWEPDPETKPT